MTAVDEDGVVLGEYWAAERDGSPTIHICLADNEIVFWLEGWPETTAQLMSPDEAQAHLESTLTWYRVGGYRVTQWCPWDLPISPERTTTHEPAEAAAPRRALRAAASAIHEHEVERGRRTGPPATGR